MSELANGLTAVLLGVMVVSGCTVGSCYALPQYHVYEKTQEGIGKLREAESSRQIATLEARAKEESARMLAKAEVERARGVAEANKIIGESLRNNDAYLRYLWVQGLNDGSSEVIYVPTEANLPLLEASRKAPRPDATAPKAEP